MDEAACMDVGVFIRVTPEGCLISSKHVRTKHSIYQYLTPQKTPNLTTSDLGLSDPLQYCNELVSVVCESPFCDMLERP